MQDQFSKKKAFSNAYTLLTRPPLYPHLLTPQETPPTHPYSTPPYRTSGHDYEGLSFVSTVPFLMSSLRKVTVDQVTESAYGETGQMILVTYGGKMSEISETHIPFPHRAGNLYQIQYIVFWVQDHVEVADKCVGWIRSLYSFMGRYVSKNPRRAYVNYRDLDIGMNFEDEISYEQSSIWGSKYFNNNFHRLVRVKIMVDPTNFFIKTMYNEKTRISSLRAYTMKRLGLRLGSWMLTGQNSETQN